MDDTFIFDQVQFIDQPNVNLVSGYLNELRQSLLDDGEDDSLCDNVPSLILSGCLLYFVVREDFTRCGSKMRINQDTLEMRFVGQNTAYGKFVIDMSKPYIYRWQIQIEMTNYQFFSFSMGIDSQTPDVGMQSEFSVSGMYGNTSAFYAYGNSNGQRGSKFSTRLPPKGIKYGEGVRVNDRVTMVLNTEQKTLQFYKNGVSFGVAFENVDDSVPYRLALSMAGLGRIRLVSFKQEVA